MIWLAVSLKLASSYECIRLHFPDFRFCPTLARTCRWVCRACGKNEAALAARRQLPVFLGRLYLQKLLDLPPLLAQLLSIADVAVGFQQRMGAKYGVGQLEPGSRILTNPVTAGEAALAAAEQPCGADVAKLDELNEELLRISPIVQEYKTLHEQKSSTPGFVVLAHQAHITAEAAARAPFPVPAPDAGPAHPPQPALAGHPPPALPLPLNPPFDPMVRRYALGAVVDFAGPSSAPDPGLTYAPGHVVPRGSQQRAALNTTSEGLPVGPTLATQLSLELALFPQLFPHGNGHYMRGESVRCLADYLQ